jgi:hypothetical protein
VCERDSLLGVAARVPAPDLGIFVCAVVACGPRIPTYRNIRLVSIAAFRFVFLRKKICTTHRSTTTTWDHKSYLCVPRYFCVPRWFKTIVYIYYHSGVCFPALALIMCSDRPHGWVIKQTNTVLGIGRMVSVNLFLLEHCCGGRSIIKSLSDICLEDGRSINKSLYYIVWKI